MKKDKDALLAEWHDVYISQNSNIIRHYLVLLKDKEEPIFEIGVATGNVIIPMAKSGKDVSGTDPSLDMLHICKNKAEKENVSLTLYHSDLNKIEFDRKYGTIFAAGGIFQLITDINDVKKNLDKIYEHLKNGGNFIADLFIPIDELTRNNSNSLKEGKTLTNPNNHNKLRTLYREEFNLKQQIRKRKIRYEIYDAAENLQHIINTYSELRWYCVNEFILLLEQAGFRKVETINIDGVFDRKYHTLYIATKLE